MGKVVVNKFKLKDGKTIVEYGIEKNGNIDELILTSDDEPLKILMESLDGLKKYVIDICELRETAEVKVTGVSLSHKPDQDGMEVLGAVIIAQNKLQNSTGVVNVITPHRIDGFYSENGDEGQLMSGEMAMDIQVLIHHIENFINGERVGAQQEMEFAGIDIKSLT